VPLHARVPTPGPVVRGDRARLYQIAANLVSNAIKFTPTGGAVHVELTADADTARLVVRDTGVGIPADVLPRVFDRFQQADASSTRRHGGLGLGLAIVHHLVERHHGVVEVSSDGHDCGAQFTVTLPRAVADEQTATDAAVRPGPAALADVRVLLVEDEDDMRTMAAFALTRHGAVVTQASGVRDALDALARQGADVVVTDLGMPDANGYALLDRIRAQARAVPVIALTGFVTGEDRAHALAAGFADHVAKPVEPEHLVRVVRRALDRDVPA
jgi:CheY-like chemotaxis protein